MSDSQREPVQPGGHSHRNPPTSSLQVAPLKQGTEAQSFMFTYSNAWHNINLQLHVHQQQCMAQHKYPVTWSPTAMQGTT